MAYKTSPKNKVKAIKELRYVMENAKHTLIALAL